MAKISKQAEMHYFAPGNRRDFEDILQRAQSISRKNYKRIKEKHDKLAKNLKHFPEMQENLFWDLDFYERKQTRSRKQTTTDRICEAACALSEEGEFNYIIVPTTSGRTTFMVSSAFVQGLS